MYGDESDYREPIWGVEAPAPVPCVNPSCRNEFVGYWGEACSAECRDRYELSIQK